MSAADDWAPGIRGGRRHERRRRAAQRVRAAKLAPVDPLADTLPPIVCTCTPTRNTPHECVRDDDESECG